jgi:hypothetical protein
MPLMKRTICDSFCLWLKRKAIYQEGLGAMLVDADFDETTPTTFPKNKIISELAFPYGNQESKDTVFSSVDYAKLNSAVANALISERTKNAFCYCDT